MSKEGRNLPELLIPAGSLDLLKTAVIYGADAVYIGGEVMSLRAKAHNFSIDDMREGIEFAHAHGVKVYVTANILAHNDDLVQAEEYFKELKELKPDAVLISDPGIFMIAKRVIPEIDIHISTQANNVNYETFLFWKNLGATRVVTGRELSLAEIKEIREHIPDDMLRHNLHMHGGHPYDELYSHPGHLHQSHNLFSVPVFQVQHPMLLPAGLFSEIRPEHILLYNLPGSRGLQRDLQPVHPGQEVPDPCTFSLFYPIPYHF